MDAATYDVARRFERPRTRDGRSVVSREHGVRTGRSPALRGEGHRRHPRDPGRRTRGGAPRPHRRAVVERTGSAGTRAGSRVRHAAVDLRLLLGSRLASEPVGAHPRGRRRGCAGTAAGRASPPSTAITTAETWSSAATGSSTSRSARCTKAERAQDPDDIGGKILRLNPDGSTPSDNPLGAVNPAYSMGHRNSFGLCVDPVDGNAVGDGERAGQRRRGQPHRARWQLRLAGPARSGRRAAVHRSGARLPRGDRPDRVRGVAAATCTSAPSAPACCIGCRSRRRTTRTPTWWATSAPAITDLQVGPDGDLYVSTSEAIWRLAGTGSPEPATSPSATPAADASDDGWRTVVAVVAGVVARGRTHHAVRRRVAAPP